MVDPSSGRATLLESIRQAGGVGKAKLRSVTERKLEKKKQKEQGQGEASPHAAGSAAHFPCGLRNAGLGSRLAGLSPPSGSRTDGRTRPQL